MAYLKQRRSTVQMRSRSRPTGCHESVPQVAHQAISHSTYICERTTVSHSTTWFLSHYYSRRLLCPVGSSKGTVWQAWPSHNI